MGLVIYFQQQLSRFSSTLHSKMTYTAPKGKYMNQSELANNLVAMTGLKRKEAKAALSAFRSIGGEEMKKVFLLIILK